MAVVLEVDSHKAGLVLVFHKKIPYSIGIGEKVLQFLGCQFRKIFVIEKAGP